VFSGPLISRYLHGFQAVRIAVQDRDERAGILSQAFDHRATFSDDQARELGVDVHEQVVGIDGPRLPVPLLRHVRLLRYVVGRIPVFLLIHFENGLREKARGENKYYHVVRST